MAIDKQTILNLIAKAQESLASTSQQVSDMKLGDKVKEEIYANTSVIQSMVDKLVSKTGLVTQEEVNALDEQIRQAKQKLLEAQANRNKRNLFLIVGGAIAVITLLWFITKEKKSAV